jgi:hypothetical protein
MRSPIGFGSFAGMLALLAAFVLALPGVKAVRAEEQRAPLASQDGPACNAPSPEVQAVQAAATAEQIQAELIARLAAQGSGGADAPILLNGRGYNYGSGAANDLRRIAIEAERSRQLP